MFFLQQQHPRQQLEPYYASIKHFKNISCRIINSSIISQSFILYLFIQYFIQQNLFHYYKIIYRIQLRKMYRKIKFQNNSQTIKNFQQFMKKRQEKTNILQSKEETVDKKITCFQQLLKLTKSGTSLVNTQQPEPAQLPKKNEKRTMKVIKKQEFSEFQQNSEEMAIKFDKMVNDLNGWNDKNKILKEPQLFLTAEKKKYSIEPQNKFFKRSLKKDSLQSKTQYVQSLNEYVRQNKEDQRHFIPLKKKNINELYKQTGKHHKSNNRLMKSIFSHSKDHFQSLKQQIQQFQHKAKQVYGMNFDKNNNIVKDQVQNHNVSSKEDYNEMLKVISRNQLKKPRPTNYESLVNQHMGQDPSVPTNLLGLVRSVSSSKSRRIVSSISRSRYIRI